MECTNHNFPTYLRYLVVCVVSGLCLLGLEQRLELAHHLVVKLQLLCHTGKIDRLETKKDTGLYLNYPLPDYIACMAHTVDTLYQTIYHACHMLWTPFTRLYSMRATCCGHPLPDYIACVPHAVDTLYQTI